MVLASFAPHLEHFSRARISAKHPVPQRLATSNPSIVLAVPQLPHSTFSAHPKRTRWLCSDVFVDISTRYVVERS